MRVRGNLLSPIVVFGSLALLAGCHHKSPITTPTPEAKPAATAPAPMPRKEVTESFKTEPMPPQRNVQTQVMGTGLERIHFAFDKYDLTAEDIQELQHNAAWLKAHPSDRILIAGNCDERGTEQYNLALGERRARAAREYLTTLGIDASRIQIVSYGKDKPLDPAHDESAWSKNRRDDFQIVSSTGAAVSSGG